ncbi:MAG: hypothetical protein ACW99J_17455 [Candidatus Thorarchaeota archaeon]
MIMSSHDITIAQRLVYWGTLSPITQIVHQMWPKHTVVSNLIRQRTMNVTFLRERPVILIIPLRRLHWCLGITSITSYPTTSDGFASLNLERPCWIRYHISMATILTMGMDSETERGCVDERVRKLDESVVVDNEPRHFSGQLHPSRAVAEDENPLGIPS